ncbi:MAG: hypothetical protein M1823_000407 [Watsoniomyces obsoletus]|nr:MAG: hypothetical protein M1823_000407 [Watsoniomyces obsoletus]
MSAPLPPSTSRRKVTTYGKTSSKRVEGFDRENERPLSSTYNVTKPSSKDSNDRTKANLNSISGQDVNASEALQERQDADLQANAPLRRAAARRPTETAESGKHGKTVRAMEQFARSRSMESGQDGEDVDVFDVPMSDEETEVHPSPRKAGSSGSTRNVRGRREQRPMLVKAPSSVVSKPSVGRQQSSMARPMSTKTLPMRKQVSASSILEDRTLQQQISLQMSTEDATMGGMDDEGMPSVSMMVSPESPPRLRPSPQESLNSPPRKTKPHPMRVEKGMKKEKTEEARKPTQTIHSKSGVSTDDETPKALKRRSPDHIGIDSTDEERERDMEKSMLLSPLRTPSPRKRARVVRKANIPPVTDDTDVETDSKEQVGIQTYSPRHAKLWGELLHGNHPPAESPSALPLERLGLSSTRPSSTTSKTQSLSSALHFPDIDAGEPGNRKRRLIDALARRSISEDADLRTESDRDGEGGEASSPTLQPFAFPTSTLQSGSQDEAQPAITSSQTTTAVDSTFDSQVTSSQSVTTSQSAGLKVTYSRQRSYLTEASLEEAVLPSISQETSSSSSNRPNYSTRRGGTSQRSLMPSMSMDLSMNNSIDDGDDEPGNSNQGGSLRTIHELRAAGVNKRFLDEFEGILDDIIPTDGASSSSSTFRRRTNLLELCLKLSKPTNVRRFIELGLERRLFSAVGNTRDIIVDFAFASLIVILSQEGLPNHSTRQINQPNTLQMLTELLTFDDDITVLSKDRKLNLTRVSKSLISDLVQQLLKQHSALWTTSPEFISPRILALSAFEIILSGGLREGGSGGDLSQSHSPLPSKAATTIVTILSQTFDLSATDDADDGDHQDVSSSSSIQKSLEIELSLSLLETCTTRSDFSGSSSDNAWTQMIKELLLYVCRDGGSGSGSGSTSETWSSSSQARRIQSSVLRLFLNITNHHHQRSSSSSSSTSSWSESLGTVDVAVALTGVISSGFRRQECLHENQDRDRKGNEDEDGDGDEDDTPSVDDLILALAALINLVESSERMRGYMLDYEQPFKGNGNRTRRRLLDALLRPFLLGLKKTSEADSMEGTHFNVAFGYLAVLLSNISFHAEARTYLCSKLPCRTLTPITDAAIEFLQYHQQVDSQLMETDGNIGTGGGRVGDGGVDAVGAVGTAELPPRDGFTERLQRMITRLINDDE